MKKKKKISGKGAFRTGKGFALFISNENMNDIKKIIKSLEKSNVLIDGITETVKHEIKNQEGGFLLELLVPLATSLVKPVISLVVKGIIEAGVRRAGKGYIDKIFSSTLSFRSIHNIKITVEPL